MFTIVYKQNKYNKVKHSFKEKLPIYRNFAESLEKLPKKKAKKSYRKRKHLVRTTFYSKKNIFRKNITWNCFFNVFLFFLSYFILLIKKILLQCLPTSKQFYTNYLFHMLTNQIHEGNFKNFRHQTKNGFCVIYLAIGNNIN